MYSSSHSVIKNKKTLSKRLDKTKNKSFQIEGSNKTYLTSKKSNLKTKKTKKKNKSHSLELIITKVKEKKTKENFNKYLMKGGSNAQDDNTNYALGEYNVTQWGKIPPNPADQICPILGCNKYKEHYNHYCRECSDISNNDFDGELLPKWFVKNGDSDLRDPGSFLIMQNPKDSGKYILKYISATRSQAERTNNIEKFDNKFYLDGAFMFDSLLDLVDYYLVNKINSHGLTKLTL